MNKYLVLYAVIMTFFAFHFYMWKCAHIEDVANYELMEAVVGSHVQSDWRVK